ncbi:MAG: TRAP transporter small permease [Lachnospiraceae bacterium]|nr:TRAP transporter small permease [Lachnospiraceae bacterium]
MKAFFEKADRIKPFFDIVYKVVLFICKVLLTADVAITSVSVAGRYISFIPDPAWTEEIVLTLMAYMAVLSASLAIRRGAHIRMTALDRYLPQGLIVVLDVISDVCVLILAIIMLVVGWQFATTLGTKGYYTSIPTLSRFWLYLPIPVAGAAMIFFEVEALYNHAKKLLLKEVEA